MRRPTLVVLFSFSAALSACVEVSPEEDPEEVDQPEPGESLAEPGGVLGEPETAIDALSCTGIDDELSMNCEIDRACSTFTPEEHMCISDLMSLEWFRPPCEEYAACLDLPLFACSDIESELEINCDIDVTCSLLPFSERLCLSELMSQLWSDPPCESYSACLGL